MNLSFTAHGDIMEIGLNGRLDAASSPEVLDALNARINAGHLKILLDFSRMDYISSSGLRVLLIAAKALIANAAGFAVWVIVVQLFVGTTNTYAPGIFIFAPR